MNQRLQCRQHVDFSVWGFPNLANRLLQVGRLSSIPRSLLSPATLASSQCVYTLERIHLRLFHFQSRISGMSWPCLSRNCLCSISLSLSAGSLAGLLVISRGCCCPQPSQRVFMFGFGEMLDLRMHEMGSDLGQFRQKGTIAYHG